jgi:hypothetical protein
MVPPGTAPDNCSAFIRMIHRLLAMLIVGFWAAMTGLLVVRELYPEATSLNAVPVTHVGRLFFQHEQSSDLRIKSANGDVGYIHVQARPPVNPSIRELEFHGSFLLPLPGNADRRISWNSIIELNPRLEVQGFRADLASQDPMQRLEIHANLIKRTARIAVKSGRQTLKETAITLDEAGFESLLSQAKISPAMLQQVKAAGAEVPALEWKAQSSSLVLGGEELSTYLLSLKAGATPLVEAHVSQLGQVLRADAPLLGFKFVPQSLTP